MAIGLLLSMTAGAAGKEGKEGKLSGLSETEIKTLDEILPYMKFVKEVTKNPGRSLDRITLSWGRKPVLFQLRWD